MTFQDKDFVSVDLDLYANGKLVQTTNEKKAKDNHLEAEKFEPMVMVLGKGFILGSLDEDIKKAEIGKEKSLELSADLAFGKRKKEMIRTFPSSAFEEQKMRPVVGMTYDFNGMYGIVKSVTRGRVMVDFNNPLAGKEIKIIYTVKEKVEDIKVKLETIFETVLRFPSHLYQIEVKEKNIDLYLPQEIHPIKEQVIKSFEDFIPNIGDFSLNLKIKQVQNK